MVKKKPFIDKAEAAHFHLVHRSQRDPKSADPEASARVLTPAAVSGNLKKGSSQLGSDLDGFGLEESIHEVEDAPTDKVPDNFGMPEDGYDYGKHLRSIGDGTFISREQARSEASAARSGVTGLSRISRASLASKQGEILLRGVADGAFASAEELSVAVGDAVGGEVSTEDQNLEAIAEMDEDMKAALFDDETLEDLEEPDDDFVIKAGEFRETELISCPARMPKRGVYAVPEEVDEGQEGELRVDADGVAYPIASYKEVYGEDWQWHWSRAPISGESRVDGDQIGDDDPAAATSKTEPTEALTEEEARRKAERRAEAFRLFSGGDDEESDSDEGGGASVTSEQPSVVAGSSGGPAPRNEARLLDRQFARLMSEYAEDEIGELDQDDPEVCRGAPVEAYEDLMDEFLTEARQLTGAGWGEKEHTATGNREFDEYRKGWQVAGRPKPMEEGPNKEDEWDAETILTTYTTTDNHPKKIGVNRVSKGEQIHLDRRTGLPVGIELPRSAGSAGPQASDAEDDGGYAEAEEALASSMPNLGEARPRKESAEEKRDRKQMVKEERRMARAQKKEVKLAYKAEFGHQIDTKRRTECLPSTNLSCVNPH